MKACIEIGWSYIPQVCDDEYGREKRVGLECSGHFEEGEEDVECDSFVHWNLDFACSN